MRLFEIQTGLAGATMAAIAAFVPVGAQSAALFDDVETIRAADPTGAGFTQRLAHEYRDLAIFEADEMYDWIDAENHAAKGVMALNGEVPMPSDPTQWGIEQAAEMEALKAARADLVSALDNGGRTQAPAEAAIAQSRYDCWVEQQEEGHQPAHIAACRDQFMAAMADLKAALAVEQTTTPVTEVGRLTVYFDFDSAALTDASRAAIADFVDETRQIEDVTMEVTGHADRAGPADYNERLSATRADAVRDALIEFGIRSADVESFVVTAEGETEPAVQTGDGVRHPQNRRVVIVAVGTAGEMVTTRQSALTGK